ncbi:MAG: hypothetical protein WCE21_02140 [Candidatus Babeliales bacterium]
MIQQRTLLLCIVFAHSSIFSMDSNSTHTLASSDTLDLVHYIDNADQQNISLFENKLTTITVPIAQEEYGKLVAHLDDQLAQKRAIQNKLKQYCLYGVAASTCAMLYGFTNIMLWAVVDKEESELPIECHAIRTSAPSLWSDTNALLSGFGFTFTGSFLTPALLVEYRYLTKHNTPVIDALEQMKSTLQAHQQ